MSIKNTKDTKRTDDWFSCNGVCVKHIHVGTTKLFQAQKLAANALKQHGRFLAHNQTTALNNFLRMANSKQRNKITQGACFKVMNIAKQVLRKCAKLTKQ